MSQVRKFTKGGTAAQTEQQSSTEAKKKYRLIINGKEMLLDDNGLADFRKAGSGQGGMMGNVYADIADALQAGNTVRYNSDSNTISGVDFKRVDPTAIAKANENQVWDKKAQRRANRYARRNNLTHQFNSALASIGNINFYKPEDDTTSSSDTLTSLYSTDPRQFDYNKGEDGTLIWSNGPQNAGNLTALNNFIDMLGMSEEDAKKKYSWTGYDDQIRDLRSWYTGNQNYDWEGLRSRIRENRLTEDDWDVLRYMGFGENEMSNNSTIQNEPRSYEGSGFNNDALERAGYYIRKDANGNPVLYDNNRQVVRDKIYLRDFDWANNSPYAGGAWYNGRFYTQDQLWNQDNDASRDFQQNYVNASLAKDEAGNKTWEAYTNALKNSGWVYAGMNDDTRFTLQDPTKSLLPGFEYLKNPYYFQDISQNYNAPENTSIIQFFDMNNRDKDGRPIMRYAVSDNDQLFNSIDELQTYLSGLSTPITRVQGIKTPRQTFQPDISRDKDGNEYINSKAILAHVIQKDGSLLDAEIYRGENGAYYFKGQNGKFYQIYGRNLMNRIINGDPITEREFEKGRDEADKRSIAGNIWNWTWLGASDDVARKTDWYNYGEYDNVLGFKKGGKINKFQFGGEFAYTPVNITKGAKSDDKIGTMHKIGGGPGLTDASDKWANAATALDTASLGASFIPGYGNIVGGIAGIGGSAARFVSDIKRDGFDGGDIGRLALNLGLDALTFIPFVGSAAKAAKMGKAAKGLAKAGKNIDKVSKAAKKTEDLISKSDVLGNIPNFGKLFKPGQKAKKVGRTLEIALPAAGTINGIGAAINVASDGEITSDELSSIATGVMSGALLGRGISRAIDRSALRAIQKKLNISAPEQSFSATFKNKDGKDITITLKGDDLSSLKGKRKKALTDLLETKVKNAGGDLEKTGIKAEDLIDRFKIPMKDGIISGINKNWNKTDIPKDKKFDVYDTEALSSQKLAETLQNPNLGYWTNRAARAYRYGLSHNADALSAIQKSTGKTITWNPAWTFGGKQSSWLDIPSVNTPSQTPKQILALPAWNPPTGNINPIQSQGPIVTPQPRIAELLPQYASSYQNAQGQLLLPRGNGRFFKRIQRVWNGGPAHIINPIQPIKYSRTPSKSTKRNIGLEQAHKQRVLQEAGRQQVPAIRGLQEDIAKVRTSEDFKNLLIKINNRGSYKEIVKNNPEIKDQLRQMFVHLDPVRLGNWMTKYNLRFKQGGKIIKAQPGTKMPFGTFVTDSSSVDPNLFNYQKSGIQFNDSNVDWTKTYGDGTFMNYRQQYLNNWNNAAFKPVIDAYLAQLSKGNNNVDLSNFSKEDFARLTQDQKLGYAHNLYTDAFANYLKLNTPATVLSIGPLTGNTPTLNIPTPELDTPAPIMSREELDAKREENIKADGSQAVGGQGDGSPIGKTKSGKGFNWDPDTFIGLANLGYSVHKNNQMYGVLDDAIRKSGKALQKEMPTEIYDRYQDHITPIYQEAANNKRQFFVPTSTDALTNYAIRQTNEDTAQQLLTEGRLKASEAYSQYLDKDLAARRAYADARRETANQNRAIMASTIMQLGQNDAARRLANNQSVQNFVMEFRNKLTQDKTKRDNLIQSYYTTKAQNDYNTAFRNYLSNADGKNYYQLFKEATDKAPNETFEDWLYRTDMNAYNKANEAGIAAAGETRWNGAASALNWFRVPDYPGLVSTTPNNPYGVRIANEKKGGKTPKYMQRHTGQKPDEAIWIQKNKDTAKALEKLHDAVIKLFMKTLS